MLSWAVSIWSPLPGIIWCSCDFFFLPLDPLGIISICFLRHFSLSPLVYSSMLHPNLLYLVPSQCIISFVLVVTLNPVLSSFDCTFVCTLTDHGQVVCNCAPLCHILCVHFSSLCCPTRSVFVNTVSSCYHCVYLIPHRVTTCHCCL